MNHSKIADLLKLRGWHQKDLAKKAGLSPTGLSKMINTGRLRVDSLEKISEAFEVSMCIWWDSDERYSNDPESEYKRKNRILNKQVKTLESQLHDKEKLINIYEKQLNAVKPKKKDGTSGL